MPKPCMFFSKRLGRAIATIAGILLFAALAVPSATAADLVYEPVNPSFGGDPLVSSHLIELADRQNRHDTRDPSRTELDKGEQFVQNLERRMLSSLAVQVNEAIFGEDASESGTIEFGDQTISFERGLEAVHLTIEDMAEGTQTDIKVPILQVE